MAEISICLNTQRRTPYGDLVGTIQLGVFEEDFHVSTRHWGPHRYARQWKTALTGLTEGNSRGCFVCSLEDPSLSDSRAFLWCYYRLGEEVVFQNVMLFLDEVDSPLRQHSFESWVPARETVSEDGDSISEWAIPLAGLTTAVRIVE